MIPRDQVQEWLSVLGRDLGVALGLDETGTCPLQFRNDELIVLEVPGDQDLLLIYGPLGPVPDQPTARLAAMADALRLNLFLHETRGGAIAVDPDSTLFLYNISHTVSALDRDRFQAMVLGFGENLTALKAKLFPAPDPDAAEVQESASSSRLLEAGGLPLGALRI